MKSPNFFTKKLDQTNEFGKFVLEPLPFSFGNSMGNALRRTLLSSLTGAAVTQVKLNGADHLFSTLKGVKESSLEVVLALKQLRFTMSGEGKFKIELNAKGARKIYAKDIKGDIEVVNGDLYIAEITDDKGKLELEAIVETGTGFLLAEEREEKETGFIAVDAFFSPVKRVNYIIEAARVGRQTNFDRLILEIWTDGSIAPEKALRDSTLILSEHFSHILSGNDTPVLKTEKSEAENKQEEIEKKFYDTIIDELNLPSRVVNALLRENIETVADLIKAGRDKLVGMKGLGKKSINLIDDELKKMGIELH